MAGFPMYAQCKNCKVGYKWHSRAGVSVRKVVCPNCGERVSMISNPVLVMFPEWIDLNEYVAKLKADKN